MADFETGDIIRIGATMLFDESYEVTNVYHVRLNGGGPLSWEEIDADIQDYMDGIMTTLDTELSLLMDADRLSVSNVTQSTVFGAMPWGAFAQGGASGQAMPPGVCCFVFARTRTPRVQLRKYYGVFPYSAYVDGEWDAGVAAACGDSMDYHIAEQTMTLGSELQGVAYNRTLLTWAYGVSVATRGRAAYQRRRKRGVGS